MLKKYISKEPDTEGNVVPADSKDGTTVAIAGVIHQASTQSWESYQIWRAIAREMGVVRPSISPDVSPIVMVNKKDSS